MLYFVTFHTGDLNKLGHVFVFQLDDYPKFYSQYHLKCHSMLHCYSILFICLQMHDYAQGEMQIMSNHQDQSTNLHVYSLRRRYTKQYITG
jgi:hypothetical protein